MSAKRSILIGRSKAKWAFLTKSRESLSGVKQYSITAEMSQEDAAPIIKEIEEVFKESGIKKQPKSMGYKTNEEGNIEFSAKTNAFFADGSANSVPIFDSKGKKVDLGDKLLGNGSEIRVKVTAATYEAGANAGVTLYLNSVQILKFIEYEGMESFDAVEGDGFTGIELDDPFEVEETASVVPKF
jgi:ABC-type oligopeptide transport system substrate-binding subunit